MSARAISSQQLRHPSPNIREHKSKNSNERSTKPPTHKQTQESEQQHVSQRRRRKKASGHHRRKKSFHRGRKFQILTPWNWKETSVQSSRSVSRWWNQDIQDVFGAKPSEHCRDGCNRKPWKDLRTDWSSGSVRTPAAELWMNRNQTDTLESPSPLLLLQPSAAVACLNF